MKPAVVASWRAFYRNALATYGIEPRDYRLLYLAQRGRCWICRKAKGVHPDDPAGRGGRRLGVDHDHLTEAVRGLLCTGGDKTCNRIIGWLGPEALQRAADYRRGAVVPAHVLIMVANEEDRMNKAGLTMTEDERVKLADAHLWRDH